MENSGFWRLNSVSDGQLQADLRTLLASGARTEARIIAHLAELEDRRLHLRAGSESLYSYCIHVLRLSNSEAFHRITAARIARRFPVVFAFLEQRALHLTAVCLLRDYLTLENHRELLAAASHKTKVQVEELIARRFPRPDVESRIRKLPTPRVTSALPQPHEPQQGEPQRHELQLPEPQHEAWAPEPRPCGPQLAVRALAPMASTSPASSSPVPAPTAVATIDTSAPRHAPQSQPAVGAEKLPRLRAIQPLSEARYRIQLNASAALKGKLDRLRELTSHSNPTGDIAELIERALDVAIERAEKQRFATTQRPRRAKGQRQAQRSATPSSETQLSREGVERVVQPRKRQHIANAVVREVVARDHERCTYTSVDGCRCTARAFLQVHHEQSWASGGADTVDNLRLLCASHNRLLAEHEFGVGYVAQRVASRSRARGGDESAQRACAEFTLPSKSAGESR